MKNNFKILGGICITMLSLGISAQATTFDLTFTDFNSKVDGVGTVSGTENSDGSYTVTSGTWDVVAGPDAGATGTILPNPSTPNPVISPSGYFETDNLLFPTGAATVDYWGLLFTTSASPSEINIFSDSPTQYEQYFNDGNDVLGMLTIRQAPSAAISAPDTTSSAGLLGVVFLGLIGTRRLVKS